MTGLPADVVAKSRGFVRNAYLQHLRAQTAQIVSSYDATFAGPDPYPGKRRRRRQRSDPGRLHAGAVRRLRRLCAR